MAEKLKGLFEALQDRLCASLGANRAVFDHPVTKGDASEFDWITMLSNHLPHRYQVDKAFVIDVNGDFSEQIDVVIYDRQYTPILYNHESQRVIPAESVYAIFEVKQEIDKKNIEYAGQKAASVRSLVRTSTKITHAGGEHGPRPPIPILAGILAYQSSWNPPLGEALKASLSERGELERIDLGCAVQSGSFEVSYGTDGTMELDIVNAEKALVHFLMRLLHRLQSVGTVTAIDYMAYSRTLLE